MKSKYQTVATDALTIIDRRYFEGRPEMQKLLQEAEERLCIAEQIHRIREKEGLTQKELAEKAGTSRTVITRLEEPGYERHTISTLRKVARAMGYRLKIGFVRAKCSTPAGKA